MNVTVFPHLLRGRIAAPPSKSHVHRLLLAAALCPDGEETTIRCPGDNADIAATLRCLQALGARVWRQGDALRLAGPLWQTEQAVLDCGESGSTLRFLLPLCALGRGPGPVTLTGGGRLPDRPLGPLLSVLSAHGAHLAGDRLPLRVFGGLQPGDFALPGNVSSQFFSGLLFALPLLPGVSTLRFLSPLESMPYVDLTLAVLRQFGIRTERIEDGWRVPGGQSCHSPGPVSAEGDWSAAAFWLGANALGSDVQLEGLDPNSCQGDRAAASLLSRIGGEINVSQTPDLMPILAMAAAALPGQTSRITGAARLRLKESDRLSATAQAIRALGGQAQETPDGLIIQGSSLGGGTVDGQNDHRIVMSAAIAATACRCPVVIRDAEAVRKSYPRFWADFQALGGLIHA